MCICDYVLECTELPSCLLACVCVCVLLATDSSLLHNPKFHCEPLNGKIIAVRRLQSVNEEYNEAKKLIFLLVSSLRLIFIFNLH